MVEKTQAELAAERRRQRAEEALKANLRRRKEQARARRAGATAPASGPDEAEPPGEDPAG